MDKAALLNTLKPIFEAGYGFMEEEDKTTEELIQWLKNVKYERGNGNGFPIFPKTPMASRTVKKRSLSSIIDREESADVSSLKSSRSAAQNATSKITKQVQASLKDKMRRPTRSKAVKVPERLLDADVKQDRSIRFGPLFSETISADSIDLSSSFSCRKSISTASITSDEHKNCTDTTIIIHGKEAKRGPSKEADIKTVNLSSGKKSRDSVDMPIPIRSSKRLCTISPTRNGEENFVASKIIVQDRNVKNNSRIDTTSEHIQPTAKSKDKILVVTSPKEKNRNRTSHLRSSNRSVTCDNDGSKELQSAVQVVPIVKVNSVSKNEHDLIYPIVVLEKLKITPQSLTNDRSMSNSYNELSYQKRISKKINSKSSPVLKLTDNGDKTTSFLQNDHHVKSPPVSITTNQEEKSTCLLQSDHVKSPLVSKTTSQEDKSTPLLQTYHNFEDKVKKLHNTSPFKSVMTSVAAYEKMNFEEGKSNAPARMTRTKAKAIAAAKANQNALKDQKNQGNRDLVKMLARVSLAKAKKVLTKQQKFLEAEASKENSVVLSQSTLSGVNSTLKKMKKTPFTTPRVLMDRNYALFCNSNNSKIRYEDIQEQIEEERNKIELKESQALQRKEELLKLKTEEHKRKREEKEEKVTLIRKANEKEKLKYQQQLDKENKEKERHVVEEREARLKKKQERLQEAAKLRELRKMEKAKQIQQEENKQNAMKKQKEEAYLKLNAEEENTWEKAKHLLQEQTKNAKPLECNEYDLGHIQDGDSDDDEENPKSRVPLWANRAVRSETVIMQQNFPAKLYRSIFTSSDIAPPDLSEMFKGINKHLLLRSSSAHWTTPPRYSTLPKF